MAALAVNIPPDPPFEVVVDRTGDIAMIVVTGELAIATAPQFDAAATRALNESPRAVVVDLTGSSFVDSVAIGVLLRVAYSVGEREGRLLVACSRQARRVFETAGLTTRLDLYKTSNDALAALSEEG
jgi:anti-sigma B factor antagonist